jgi:hypothetical protein
MDGTFDPKDLIRSIIPLDCLGGFKPWVGMSKNTLLICGIIDGVLPWCGIELFGFGLIIASCAASGEAKAAWTKAAVLNTLFLIFFFWIVVPIYVGIGFGILMICLALDTPLVEACGSSASLAKYSEAWTKPGQTPAVTSDVEQPTVVAATAVVPAAAVPTVVATPVAAVAQ